MLHGGQDEIKAFLWEPEPEERWNDSEDEEDGDDREQSNVAEWSDDEGGGEGDSERAWDTSKSEKRPSNLDGF